MKWEPWGLEYPKIRDKITRYTCLTGGLGRGAAERCSKSPNSEFVLLHEGDDATILSIVRGAEDGNAASTQVMETTLACIKYNQI